MTPLKIKCPKCEAEFKIKVKRIEELEKEVAELNGVIKLLKNDSKINPYTDPLENIFGGFKR